MGGGTIRLDEVAGFQRGLAEGAGTAGGWIGD